MIKDLIIKLTEEATAETEHKGWCDAELVSNKLTREASTQDVSELSATIEELTADIAQLTQDLADLAAGIKELSEAMAATKDRMESKATNEQTIKDAKEAQAAVEEAIAVVKDYYAKSAEATALAQKPSSNAIRGCARNLRQTLQGNDSRRWQCCRFLGSHSY